MSEVRPGTFAWRLRLIPHPNRPNGETWPPHLDAVIAAPENHRVLMDDETIRVLEVTVEPGEREALHHHRWPSVMVVLARPGYVNRDANGTIIPPAGGAPIDAVLPRAIRLPPQAIHAIELMPTRSAASMGSG